MKRWFQNNPALVLIIVGIPLLVFSLIMDYKEGLEKTDFFGNLTSSVIDIFMLGFVVIAYNKLSEKKERIQRYREEIESYRPWKEKEATYRICGLIRSLNKLNIFDIVLYQCYLPKAPLRFSDLHGAMMVECQLQRADVSISNLRGADLTEANLSHAFLDLTTLSKATLRRANLEGASLRHTALIYSMLSESNLSKANLQGANLRGAFLVETNLEGANLEGAKLLNAKLRGTNLQGANLQGAKLESIDWIEKLEEMEIKGIENIKERYCVVEVKGGDGPAYIVKEKHDQPL